MLKIIKEKTEIDEKEKTVKYIIVDNYNDEYIGISKCREDDRFSIRGGELISEARARIKFIKGILKKELYPKREVLYHLNSIMEDKKIKKQIYLIQESINFYKETIIQEEMYILTCINTLDAISARSKKKKDD